MPHYTAKMYEGTLEGGQGCPIADFEFFFLGGLVQ